MVTKLVYFYFLYETAVVFKSLTMKFNNNLSGFERINSYSKIDSAE
jgi:hypothetical protein